MTETAAALFKMGFPPAVAWAGGTMAAVSMELDPDVIYPLLAAVAVAIWRFATFVKGVQDAIKDADEDRKKLAAAMAKIEGQMGEHSAAVAIISANCPAARGRNPNNKESCPPLPTA